MSDVVFSSFHTHLRDRSDVENAILEWEQMESSLPPPPDIPGLTLISEVLMPSMWKTRKPSPAEWGGGGLWSWVEKSRQLGQPERPFGLGLGPSANSHLLCCRVCVFICPHSSFSNTHFWVRKSWLSLHACFLQKGARACMHAHTHSLCVYY